MNPLSYRFFMESWNYYFIVLKSPLFYRFCFSNLCLFTKQIMLSPCEFMLLFRAGFVFKTQKGWKQWYHTMHLKENAVPHSLYFQYFFMFNLYTSLWILDLSTKITSFTYIVPSYFICIIMHVCKNWIYGKVVFLSMI